MGALLHDGAGRSDVDFPRPGESHEKTATSRVVELTRGIKQSRPLASNALALKGSEACREAQSKAGQDTQPVKQEVEHAQVVAGPGHQSKKQSNTTAFSRLVWTPTVPLLG
jgi:hypothetical protein